MFLLPLCAFVHSEDRSDLSGYFANVCHSLVSVSGYPQLTEQVLFYLS